MLGDIVGDLSWRVSYIVHLGCTLSPKNEMKQKIWLHVFFL